MPLPAADLGFCVLQDLLLALQHDRDDLGLVLRAVQPQLSANKEADESKKKEPVACASESA
jgi:hypothetical protein